MESSQQDMENLKATVKFLKTELELQKQRNSSNIHDVKTLDHFS